MTAQELRAKFANEFEIYSPYPDTYNVDAETYANVFNFLVNHHYDDFVDKDFALIRIGPNRGIMFKGVELLLERKK